MLLLGLSWKEVVLSGRICVMIEGCGVYMFVAF